MSLCRCLSRYNRPRPVAWVFFLLAFSVLMALTAWQLERLAWKQTLLAQLAQAKAAPPLVGLPTQNVPPFHRITITGKFDTREFHVTPRYYKNKLGYHIFVPFTLEDGRVVMVNRGWVPTAQKELDSRPGTQAPTGKTTLIVMVRDGSDRNSFTPDSQPEKNIWFGRDVTRMGEYAHIENLLPYSLDIVGERKDGVLPIPTDGEITLLNDHLQYAITWFLIGITALIVFVLFHRKEKGDV